MKYIVPFMVGLVVGTASLGLFKSNASPNLAQTTAPQVDTSNWTDAQKASYGIGYGLSYEVVAGLEFDEVDADADLVAKGFSDGIHGKPAALDPRSLERIMVELHRDVAKRAVAKLKANDPEFAALCERKAAEAKTLLDNYRENPDVQAFDNGILYQVLESGSSKSPGADDEVVVNCRMVLADGTVIVDEESTEVFVDTVIDGGQYVLQHMKVGDHWKVAIPPQLAHGEAGKSPMIGPNEVILCDVTLLEVK